MVTRIIRITRGTRITRTTRIKTATRIKMAKTVIMATPSQTVELECAKVKMDMDLVSIPALILKNDPEWELFCFMTGVMILVVSVIRRLSDPCSCGC